MQPNGNRIPSRKAGLCRKPHYHSKARRRYLAGHCNRLPTMAIIPTTHQQSRRSKKHSKVSRLGRFARLYEIGQVLLVRMSSGKFSEPPRSWFPLAWIRLLSNSFKTGSGNAGTFFICVPVPVSFSLSQHYPYSRYLWVQLT